MIFLQPILGLKNLLFIILIIFRNSCIMLELSENHLLVKKIEQILSDLKFEDIVQIDLDNKSLVAEKMIVATGRSEKHISSSAKKIKEMIKNSSDIIPSIEGEQKSDWLLIDLGFLIIHLFKSEIRKIYNIEELWQNYKKHTND